MQRQRARADQVLGDPHHRLVVAVRLVQLQHRELRVVFPVDALVAEVPTHLVDPLEAADQQSLQVELERDAELEVGVQRVVVGRERLGQRAAGDRLQDGRLDLGVSATVQLLTDRAQHGGARRDVPPRRRVGDQVQVAPSLLEIGVLQPVPLLGQRTQRLRQQGERVHLERELPATRAHDVARGADDVAQVDLVEQPVSVAERRLLAEELQVAAAIADDQERQLAVPTGQHDATGDGRASVGLLLVRELPVELGDEVRRERVDVVAERERFDPGLAEALE